jgi:hypothetical protein
VITSTGGAQRRVVVMLFARKGRGRKWRHDRIAGGADASSGA